ncbi:MAG: hypothetical protein PHS74_11885 [Lachnospiraceae bacterium]|nr:hypothetical protein [Lachnospiraceae bacterium]
MIFNIGIAEFGFSSALAFFAYGFGNILLLILYWITWMLYFVKQSTWKGMALAILPTLMFLLRGIALGHVLLIITAVVFGVSHCFITYKNVK